MLYYPTAVTVDSAGNLISSITTPSPVTAASTRSRAGCHHRGGRARVCWATMARPPAPRCYYPTAITIDSAGDLTSPNTTRPQVSNGVITTVAGTDARFQRDNGLAASAQLNNPQGVAVDSAGNLYIADSGNNCVRKIANG